MIQASCPTGFVQEPSTKNCFQIVLESHNWADSSCRCNQLFGSTLAVIDNAATDSIVNGQLKALNPSSEPFMTDL